MPVHHIHLIGGADEEAATIETATSNRICHITLRYRDRAVDATAYDFFEAFCAIRRQLESERLIPFCYGASLNVYPSGMCRDMGEGLAAYRLTLGANVEQAIWWVSSPRDPT